MTEDRSDHVESRSETPAAANAEGQAGAPAGPTDGSAAEAMRERARRSSPQLILGMASDADPGLARERFAEITSRIQSSSDPAFSLSDATGALEAVESGKALGPRLQIPADAVLLRCADMPGLLHPAAAPMPRRSEPTTEAARRRYAQRALLETATALMDTPEVTRSVPMPYRVT